MEASSREWLRARRDLILIGETDSGEPYFEFDDYELYDAIEDYLVEDCKVEDFVIEEIERNARWRIIFTMAGVSAGSLQDLVARI